MVMGGGTNSRHNGGTCGKNKEGIQHNPKAHNKVMDPTRVRGRALNKIITKETHKVVEVRAREREKGREKVRERAPTPSPLKVEGREGDLDPILPPHQMPPLNRGARAKWGGDLVVQAVIPPCIRLKIPLGGLLFFSVPKIQI